MSLVLEKTCLQTLSNCACSNQPARKRILVWACAVCILKKMKNEKFTGHGSHDRSAYEHKLFCSCSTRTAFVTKQLMKYCQRVINCSSKDNIGSHKTTEIYCILSRALIHTTSVVSRKMHSFRKVSTLKKMHQYFRLVTYVSRCSFFIDRTSLYYRNSYFIRFSHLSPVAQWVKR